MVIGNPVSGWHRWTEQECTVIPGYTEAH